MRTPPSRTAHGTVLAGALCALLTLAAAPAGAETPSPAPSPTPPSASPSPAPSADPGPPTAPTPTPTASTGVDTTTSPTPAPTPSGRVVPQTESDPGSLTLRVAALGSPVAGRFYEDLGRYGFSGQVSGIADGSAIEVYRRSASGTWAKVATATVASGVYATSLPVTAKGVTSFQATTGGAPGSGDEVSSAAARVTVADSTVHLTVPAGVNSLKNPTLKGSVSPARAGVHLHLAVRIGSTYKVVASPVTNARGQFSATFAHGRTHLARYRVRTAFHAANRDRWETSASHVLRRVAVLDAVATDTTKADVADTYRRGCPVGRSKLQTVRMNYYGFDHRMHRGVLIIRTDLVPEITRSFRAGLAARYPIAKMKNPNAYGGNDPKQMKANNTSGFNCRKVVGNPYAQSPHSYGIAIDVNTVQNPYRDGHGKWWPSNGKKYRDRSPLKKGMLGKFSTLTKKLTSEDFFWGGRWNPGRDYQHFEYRP
ncbi:M15 family metallopeptidase [uncultured Friedmanniella sp.]|uniref:M15 family metallopeptidase n=1 Tax=uncultured Friedmanniella sp. TaxID=335381 RepID=UPI0035CC946A